MAISNTGDNINSVPAPTKETMATNYQELASGSTEWVKQ